MIGLGNWDVYGHFEGICHSIHNAIAQLSMNLDPQNYDLMNIGPVEDVVGEVCTMAMETAVRRRRRWNLYCRLL